MKISKATFAGSSTRISNKPQKRLPEFAFIGRSNVGKSSLINMLCENKKLAMTSSTPGKTKLVNHFIINNEWYLVDLPGYGFAKMPLKEKEKLSEIIRDYLNNSEEMILLFVLIDSRHDIQKIDMEFIDQLGENGIPFSIIFTKGESNKSRLLEHWESLPPCFVSSSETGMGREDILNHIGDILKKLKSNKSN